MVAQTLWEHAALGPQTQLQLISSQPQNKQNNMTMTRLCLFSGKKTVPEVWLDVKRTILVFIHFLVGFELF